MCIVKRMGADIGACSVILTLLAGMMGAGLTLYSAVFLYAFLANAFFLVRCVSHSPSILMLTSHPSVIPTAYF